MTREFDVVVERDADGYYVASVPGALRLVGLLAALIAAVGLLIGGRPTGSLPRNVLGFAVLAELVGPLGLAVAAASSLLRRPVLFCVVAGVSYVASLAVFILFAVNAGAIAP